VMVRGFFWVGALVEAETEEAARRMCEDGEVEIEPPRQVMVGDGYTGYAHKGGTFEICEELDWDETEVYEATL